MKPQDALKLLEQEENLPVLPQLFYQIVEAASDPDTPISELSRLILEDQVLTGRIIKERLDVEWICEGRVDYSSYDLMRAMTKAGCKIIYFGIESANQRILDYYQKQITPHQSRTAIRTARKAGMDIIVGSFIVGAPTETRREIENTLRFAQEVPIDVPQYNILGVFPGMDIWDEFKAKGYLTKEQEKQHWEMGIAVANVYPDTVSYEEIKSLIRQYYRQFFMQRPNFLLAQLARTLRSPYRLNIVKTNLSRIGAITKGWKDFVAFEGEEQSMIET